MRVPMLAALCLATALAAADAAGQSVEESAGDWRIACFDEDITEYRDCYVIRGSLAVLISGQGYEIVIVGHGYDRTPDSEVAVQVDDNREIRWRVEDLYADQAFDTAIRQFRAGQNARVRFNQGEHEIAIDGEVSLIGFTKAYQRAQRLVRDYEP